MSGAARNTMASILTSNGWYDVPVCEGDSAETIGTALLKGEVVGNQARGPVDGIYTGRGALRQTIVPTLGDRALAVVLKCEWGGEGVCLWCGQDSWKGHKPDCEWGRIVAAAKEIG